MLSLCSGFFRRRTTSLLSGKHTRPFSRCPGLTRRSETASRTPNRILDPETLQPLPQVRTRLEDNLQAQEEARKAAATLKGTRLEKLKPRFSPNRPPQGAETPVRLEEFTGNEEADDSLPEGLRWEDLPRFKRIHGWDKTNKHLRQLSWIMTHRGREDDAVLVEGKRLIIDAMKAGLHPSIFLFSRLNLLSGYPFDLSRDLAMYQIPYRNIKAWSELKSHPGVMAVFSRREVEDHVATLNHADNSSALPVTLVLDNVRNPDNLGALLRVAAAIGCRATIALQGCVDPWQSKVLRAGSGAHFRMQIHRRVPWDSLYKLIPKHPQVVLADLNRDDTASEVNMSDEELSRRLAALEERSQEFWLKFSPSDSGDNDNDQKRSCAKTTSSIRTVVGDATTKSPDVFEQFEKIFHEQAKEEEARDFSYYEEDIIAEYGSLPLISKEYQDFSTSFAGQELVVVIGGETEGISPQAKKFAHSYLGERVFIPLSSGMDSLNVASAASVILFEIRKKVFAP